MTSPRKSEICESCPLRDEALVPGQGDPGGLLIVGEAPGREEVNVGRPFVGRSGQLLRAVLTEVGIETPIYTTNACLCWPGQKKPPPKEALECCRQRLFDEIVSINPQVILTVGAVARGAFSEGSNGILKNRGIALQWEGFTVLPTIHPAYVLRNPRAFTDFANDLIRLRKLLAGEMSQLIPPPSIQECRTPGAVWAMAEELKASRSSIFSLDLETTGLNPRVNSILSVGISESLHRVWTIPGELLRADSLARGALRGLLEDPSISWVGQNIVQFDTAFLLLELGIDCIPAVDTLLASYLLDERAGGHDLQSLATHHYDAPNYESEIKALFKAETFPGDDDPQLLQYLGWDCLYTLLLGIDLPKRLEAEDLTQTLQTVIMPAAFALRDVENVGIKVDIDALEAAGRELVANVNRDRAQLRRFAEKFGFDDFNPQSPPQVAKLLFDDLKIPSTGRSTGKEILEELSSRGLGVEIIPLILGCRRDGKLIGTYINGIRDRIESDGRIHTEFRIPGTATGRISSRDPNLQNIPVLMGPLIRNIFVAEPGWVFVKADYSQLELRVAGMLSGDSHLLEIYNEGRDVHAEVAAAIYKKPVEDVTYEERYTAKYVDFGILYGRGATSLAHDQLHCSIPEAQTYIDEFLADFVELNDWMELQRKNAQELGYVTTAFGRRRRFPLILDSNLGEVHRQAVNSPIQGTASDICLTALTRLRNRWRDLWWDTARIVLTVHDEIITEVREDYLETAIKEIRTEMVDNVQLDSPIRFDVDFEVGHRWGSLQSRDVEE